MWKAKEMAMRSQSRHRERVEDWDGRRSKRDEPGRGEDYRHRSRDHRSKSEDYRSRSKDDRGIDREHRGRSRDDREKKREHGSTSKDDRGIHIEHRSRSKDDRGTMTEHRGRSRDDRGMNKEHRSRSKDDRGAAEDHRSRSRDDRGKRKEHRSRSRDDRGNIQTASSYERAKKRAKDSDSDSDEDSSSEDEDVEERYCRACELALAKCQISKFPNPMARVDSLKYFLSSPVCFMHSNSRNVVKEDKLISLEDLWKEMLAKEPCAACDAARKSALPLPSPYENARTEGEKYFLPSPFCPSHRKRENILYEDDLVSVKKYWKGVKKSEVCMACKQTKKWCRPLPVVNNRAFTEAERWFYPSPLCLRHKDRRKILDDNGEVVMVEEYWKVRLEAEKKEAEKREAERKEAEKKQARTRRVSSRRRTDSVSSSDDERGRSRWYVREERIPSRAPDLLSPDYTAPYRQQPRGRPRSTVDPLGHTTDHGPHDRRRPSSFDASRPCESDARKSRSPSPYPVEWTDDQKREYFECFRALAQPSHEKPTASNSGIQIPPAPPAPAVVIEHGPHPLPPPPPNTANQTTASFIPPPASSHRSRHTGTAADTADFLSPDSAMSASFRGGHRDSDSSSDDSDDSLPDRTKTCKKHSIALDQCQGDILFVNNLSMLHSRGTYVDDVSSGQCRHLLSMMLRDAQVAWKKDGRLSKYIDDRFAQLPVPQFFGTVEDYEKCKRAGGVHGRPDPPGRHD